MMLPFDFCVDTLHNYLVMQGRNLVLDIFSSQALRALDASWVLGGRGSLLALTRLECQP